MEVLTRKLIGKIVIKVCILGLIGVGAWYGFVYVASLQRTVVGQQQELERKPVDDVQQTSAAAEFMNRQADIAQVKKFLVDRSQLNDVISAIEGEGSLQGITVEIPNIEEIRTEDDKGVAKPVEEVRVQIAGFGNMTSLLQFLHRVEHMPYLVRLETWTVEQGSSPTYRSANTIQVGPADDKQADVPPVPSSELRADLIVGLNSEAN